MGNSRRLTGQVWRLASVKTHHCPLWESLIALVGNYGGLLASKVQYRQYRYICTVNFTTSLNYHLPDVSSNDHLHTYVSVFFSRY